MSLEDVYYHLIQNVHVLQGKKTCRKSVFGCPWTTKSEDNYQANEFWWLRSTLRSDFSNKANEINGKEVCLERKKIQNKCI